MPFKKKKNETEMTAEQNPQEEEEKAGGKLVFCDSEIRDETGKLITTGHTVMYFTGKQLA